MACWCCCGVCVCVCVCVCVGKGEGMLSHTHTYTCHVRCAGVQGGQLTPIDLIVEERFHRAAPGGMGGTKAAGNYSPVRPL